MHGRKFVRELAEVAKAVLIGTISDLVVYAIDRFPAVKREVQERYLERREVEAHTARVRQHYTRLVNRRHGLDRDFDGDN